MNQDLFRESGTPKGVDSRPVTPAFNPGQMTNAPIRKQFMDGRGVSRTGQELSGDGLTDDEKRAVSMADDRRRYFQRQQRDQQKAQQDLAAEQSKIAFARRDNAFKEYAEATGREYGKDEFGRYDFTEGADEFRERRIKEAQERIAKTKETRAKEREAGLRDELARAEWRASDKELKPLSDSEREKLEEEATASRRGIGAILGLGQDPTDDQLAGAESTQPQLFAEWKAKADALAEDDQKRAARDESDKTIRNLRGKLVGEVPDEPLSTFGFAKRQGEIEREDRDHRARVAELEGQFQRAQDEYQATLGEITSNIQGIRASGANVNDLAAASRAAGVSRAEAETKYFRTLRDLETERNNLDVAGDDIAIRMEELNEQAASLENASNTNPDPAKRPAETPPAAKTDGNEYVSTDAAVLKVQPDGSQTIVGKPQKGRDGESILTTQDPETLGDLLRSPAGSKPIYLHKQGESPISEEEIDSRIQSVTDSISAFQKRRQDEFDKRYAAVHAGKMSVSEAESKQASAAAVKEAEELDSLRQKTAGEALNDFAGGNISVQQLEKIWKGAGLNGSGVETFQTLDKERIKEEEAYGTVLEKQKGKKAPQPPKKLPAGVKDGTEFLQQYFAWDADPKNSEASPEAIKAFETLKNQRDAFELEIRQDLEAQGITGEAANEIVMRAAFQGFRERVKTAGDVWNETKIVEFIPFIAGIAEATSLWPVAETAWRMEQGETVSQEEQDALEDFIIETGRDSTAGGQILTILKMLPAFMGEFVASGGIYSAGRAVGRKAAVEALERITKKKVSTLLAKKATDSFGKKAIRFAGRLGVKSAGGVVGATIQTPFAAATRIPAGMIRDMATRGFQTGKLALDPQEMGEFEILVNQGVPGPSLIGSLGRSAFDNWAEVVSEHSGGLFNALAKPLKAAAMRGAIVRAIKRINGGKSIGQITSYVRRAGWNGTIAEMLEERVGEAIRGIGYVGSGGVVGEEWKMPTLKQIGIELAAFAVPGSAIGVLSDGWRIAAERPLKRQIGEGQVRYQKLTESSPAEIARMASAQTSEFEAPEISPEQYERAREWTGGNIDQLPGVRQIDLMIRDTRLGLEDARARGDGDSILAHQRILAQLEGSKTDVALRDVATASYAFDELARTYQAINEDESLDEAGKLEAIRQVDIASAVLRLGSGTPFSELTSTERTAIEGPIRSIDPENPEAGPVAVDLTDTERPIVTDEGIQVAETIVGPDLARAFIPQTEAEYRSSLARLDEAGAAAETKTAEPSPTEQGSSPATTETGTAGTRTATGKSIDGVSVSAEVPNDATQNQIEKTLQRNLPDGEILDRDTVEVFEPTATEPATETVRESTGQGEGTGEKQESVPDSGRTEAKPGTSETDRKGESSKPGKRSPKRKKKPAGDAGESVEGVGKPSGKSAGGKKAEPGDKGTTGRKKPDQEKKSDAKVPRLESVGKIESEADVIALLTPGVKALTAKGIKAGIVKNSEKQTFDYVAFATHEKIVFNVSKIFDQAKNQGLDSDKIENWVNGIFSEELRHYALRRSLFEEWDGLKKPKPDFNQWQEQYFARVWNSDIVGTSLEVVVREAYTAGRKNVEVEDYQLGEEGIRIVAQQLAEGKPTEEVMLFLKGVEPSFIDRIRTVIELLKQIVSHEDFSPRIKESVQRMETELNRILAAKETTTEGEKPKEREEKTPPTTIEELSEMPLPNGGTVGRFVDHQISRGYTRLDGDTLWNDDMGLELRLSPEQAQYARAVLNEGKTSDKKEVEQAREDTDTEASPAQKEAGNYKKGKVTVQGLDIRIENPKGSYRWKLDVDSIEKALENADEQAKRTPINKARTALKALREGKNDVVPRAFEELRQVADSDIDGATEAAISKILEKGWFVKMAHDYGDIKRTVGSEGNVGEGVDVFLGPNLESSIVFVIDQESPGGEFDEHKVLLGFNAMSVEEAGAEYAKNYEEGWHVGPVSMVSMTEFKEWLKRDEAATGDRFANFHEDYKKEVRRKNESAKPKAVEKDTKQEKKTETFEKTKEGFLKAYRAELLTTYAWARNDPKKLENFVENTRTTITTNQNLVALTDSTSATLAWRKIGGKGKVSYKALRALPEEKSEEKPAENGYTLEQVDNILDDLRRKRADQGAVTDARLETQISNFEKLRAELTAEEEPAPATPELSETDQAVKGILDGLLDEDEGARALSLPFISNRKKAKTKTPNQPIFKTTNRDGIEKTALNIDGSEVGIIETREGYSEKRAAIRLFPKAELEEADVVHRIAGIEIEEKYRGQGLGQRLYLEHFRQFPEGHWFYNSQAEPGAVAAYKAMQRKGLVEIFGVPSQVHLVRLTSKGRSAEIGAAPDRPANAAELPTDYQRSIPKKARNAILDIVDAWVAEGVDTPAALVARVNAMGEKYRPFTDALWSIVRIENPKFEVVTDWAPIYEEIATETPSAGPSVEESGTPAEEEVEQSEPESEYEAIQKERERVSKQREAIVAAKTESEQFYDEREVPYETQLLQWKDGGPTPLRAHKLLRRPENTKVIEKNPSKSMIGFMEKVSKDSGNAVALVQFEDQAGIPQAWFVIQTLTTVPTSARYPHRFDSGAFKILRDLDVNAREKQAAREKEIVAESAKKLEAEQEPPSQESNFPGEPTSSSIRQAEIDEYRAEPLSDFNRKRLKGGRVYVFDTLIEEGANPHDAFDAAMATRDPDSPDYEGGLAEMPEGRRQLAKIEKSYRDTLEFHKKQHRELQEKKKSKEPEPDTPAEAAQEVKAELAEVAKEEGPRDAAEIKKELLEQIDSAIEDAPEKISGDFVGTTTVRFEIPGDGTFTIANTKNSLAEIRKRVERMSPKNTLAKPPGSGRSPNAGMAYVGDLDTLRSALPFQLDSYVAQRVNGLMTDADAKKVQRVAKEKGQDFEAAVQSKLEELGIDESGKVIGEGKAEPKPEPTEKPAEQKPAPEPEPVATEDSGEELVANRRGKMSGGVKWDDIKDKNATLQAKETTKAKVYPKPDYQALVDGGMNPVQAYLVKIAYDGIAAKPQKRGKLTPEDFQAYIDGVNHVMDSMMRWVEDPKAIGMWAAQWIGPASAIGKAAAGKQISMMDLVQSGERGPSPLDFAYPDRSWKETPNIETVRLLGGNKILKALQPNHRDAEKLSREIDKGWPVPQESWQRQGFEIKEPKDIKIAQEYRYEGDNRKEVFLAELGYRNIGRGATREEAEKFVAGLKPFLLTGKKLRVPYLEFDTREEAVEAARDAAKATRSGSRVSEKGIRVEAARREGPEHRKEGENITSDRLRETFGFKGVNFGNWMKGKSNTDERQLHLNHACDSFMDLADVLGVPPKAMSLNGLLGIAFGAQGSGGGVAAHFVPGVNEINLTRKAGAGSLAHEWAHGLDHYFAVQAGLATVSNPFLTEYVGRKPSGEIRPEIVDSFQKIVEAMSTREETPQEVAARRNERKAQAIRYTESWLKSIRADYERNDVDLAKFDALAEKILKGNVGEGKVKAGKVTYLDPVVAELRELYREKTGRVYSMDQISGLQGNVDSLMYLKSERSHKPQTKSTDYQKNARKLDKDENKRYWSTKLEMFARAFDAYVSDRLEAKAQKNTYLSHVGRMDETTPAEVERETINQAFNELFDVMETRETESGVAAYAAELPEPGASSTIFQSSVEDAMQDLRNESGADLRYLANEIASSFGLNPAETIDAAKRFASEYQKAEKEAVARARAEIPKSVASTEDLREWITGGYGIAETGGQLVANYAEFDGMTPEVPQDVRKVVVREGMDLERFQFSFPTFRKAVQARDASGNVIPLSERFPTDQSAPERAGAQAANLPSDFDSIDDVQAISKLIEDLIPYLPASERMERLRRLANEEEEGQRTMGNPDVANPGDSEESRRAYDVMRIAREGLMETDRETQDEWIAEARKRIAEDRAGVIRKLLKTATSDKPVFSKWETKAAQILINEIRAEAIAKNSQNLHETADILTFAYQEAGREQARAFFARRDAHKTPRERHLEFINHVLVHIPEDEMRSIKRAWQPSQKDRKISRLKQELESARGNLDTDKVKRLSKELKAAQENLSQAELRSRAIAKRNAKIKSVLRKGYGVTLNEIFNGEAVVRLRGSKIVQQVLDKNFSKVEAAALRDSVIDGEGFRAVGRRYGFGRTNEMENLVAKFKRLMKARFVELAKRGFTLQDFAKGNDQFFFRDQERPAQAATLTDEEKEIMATVDAMMEALFVDTPALNSGRVKKIDSLRSGKTRKGKKLPESRIDVSNRTEMTQVLRAIQAEVDHNGFDMTYEYWINGILSGPQTQVVNIVGNFANVAFEYGIQRWLEIGIGHLFRTQEGPKIQEMKGFLKGFPRAWAKAQSYAREAWLTEFSFFDADHLNKDSEVTIGKAELQRLSIPGKAGRIVRIPGRALLYFDTFFKAFIGYIEVRAQAYRLGKSLGLEGKDLEDYAKEQELHGSEAWHAAVEKSRELTFTQPLRTSAQGGGSAEAFAKSIMEWRQKKKLGRFGSFALGFLFPFIQTPFRIFQFGLRRTPLGLLGIFKFYTRGLFKMRDGQPFLENVPQARMVRDLADQTIAWTLTGLLLGASEGDGDDDDKLFLITGSHPYGVETTSERDAANRLNGGPYMIRIGNRKNGTWYDYGRIEPAATTLATIVDAIRGIKRVRHGKPATDEMMNLFHYGLSQASEKTFLKGISSLWEFINNPDKKVEAIPKFVATALVPNLFRQPIRNLDSYAREYRTAPWYYHALPVGDFAAKKIDIFGNEIKKGETPLLQWAKGTTFEEYLRAADPFLRILWDVGYRPYDEIHPLDKAMREFERINPGEEWYPSRNYIDRYRNPMTKELDMPMTRQEFEFFNRIAGQEFSRKATGALGAMDIQAPTDLTLEKAKKSRAGVFPSTRNQLFSGGVPPQIPIKPKSIAERFGVK